MNKLLLCLFLIVASHLPSAAQYNFTAGYPVVYNILNTKCSNSTCHSAGAAGTTLRFDTTAAAVYVQIISQPPVNAAALTRGEQLVWIDQPYQSYLLKKAGSWFDTDLGLPLGEPDSTYHSQASTGLTNIQVEYIRQWIMDSAAQFKLDIDTAVINAYYTDTATSGPFSPKMPKPAAGAGVQLRYGPFFIKNTAGQNQVEYLLMNQVNFPTDVETTEMNVDMTSFSHHFILSSYNAVDSALANNTGLREVQIAGANTVSPFDADVSVCSVWLYPQDIKLPTQTAFFWSATTYFNLDFHMVNYSTYAILPFDVYVNLSTRTRDVTDNTIQMKSRENNNNTLGHLDRYPPNHLNTILAHTTSVSIDEDQSNGTDGIRYIWMINSHTHKMGAGFNIMTYDNTMPNDMSTDTIYNGFMSYNSPNGVINQGYYDWEHPPVEFFPNLLPINFTTSGLIAETTYTNDSSFNQVFGLNTAQEMQFFYYLYTSSVPDTATGLLSLNKPAFDFSVYPNPMSGTGTLSYMLSAPAQIEATITDITGKAVATLQNEKESTGSHSISIGDNGTISSGMYFATVSVNSISYTRKFVVE